MNDHTPVASRTMGFRAGPHDHTFFACAEHRKYLEEPVPNFFLLKDAGIEDVPADAQDGQDCYFCREGGE